MLANVFRGAGKFGIEEVPIAKAGPGEALMRVTLTTVCGSDLHIVRGEHPVRPGLIIGHEAVGVVHALGAGVHGVELGQRVLASAITPCGQCRACLSSHASQCGGDAGYRALGGWRFGNTINGSQAEYVVVPDATANLAAIPESVSDEQALLLADITSTGFAGAEAANIRIGDAVVVFALGPIGLCAAAGARLQGAALIIGVDPDPLRRATALRFGADLVFDPDSVDVVAEVHRVTGGGADVAIEALGTQATFEAALRCLRPAGTLSSLGVYTGKLAIPMDAFASGIGDARIVTSLCPGGKERMRRLLELVRHGHFDPAPLITHRYRLGEIAAAYELFGEHRDGVLKIAITP